jgi:lipoate-protein ligase A
MRLLDRTLSTLAANLALDEALLQSAEAGEGPEVLRFWEWERPAVVLGSGCSLVEDVDEAACAADGVPIIRRASGGGTVLLGKGCLLFSLVLSYERAAELRKINSSYAYILDRLARALSDLADDIYHAGTSDLAAGELKFSGNAQQRKQRHLLHHGTLLYAFDVAAVARYLREPARQPDYRRQRMHRAFLTNLRAEPVALKSRLEAAWPLDGPFREWPRGQVEQLVGDKYDRAEWTRRR